MVTGREARGRPEETFEKPKGTRGCQAEIRAQDVDGGRAQPERELEHMDLEEALIKLENIVAELDRGDLCLEECLDLFEEGIRLSSYCLSLLNQAESET